MTVMRQRRWIYFLACPAVVAGAALWVAGCATVPAPASGAAVAPVVEETAYLESHGRRIRMDVVRPVDSGRHPAVILLHGSSGLHALFSGPIPDYADTLAHDGLVAVVLHYFDATGDYLASDEDEKASYFHWVDVVKDAVTWVRKRPDVQSHKVGLLGHSLGAWLAVGAAAMDKRVDGIVLFGGGLEPFLAHKIRRMPPTLMFHGDEDDVVPLADATTLATYLRAHKWPVELCVYPGEGHELDDAAASDALAYAAGFLGVGSKKASRTAHCESGVEKEVTAGAAAGNSAAHVQ